MKKLKVSDQPNSETLNAILLAKAKDEGKIFDDTPGFTDSKKMIKYVKNRLKELN